MTAQPPAPSTAERVWRGTLFVLSAAMAASAFVDFDAGRFAKGLGDLGASILMLSMMVQFPFVQAMVKASRDTGSSSPDKLRKQREELVQQADKVRTANPWAEVASRTGWVLLALSLVLRITGVA